MREARIETRVRDFMTGGGKGKSNERMTGVLSSESATALQRAWGEPERERTEVDE